MKEKVTKSEVYLNLTNSEIIGKIQFSKNLKMVFLVKSE